MMRVGRLMGLAAVLLALVTPRWGAAEDMLGKKAYEFKLKDVQGNNVSLRDFRGKIVILDFWAVWCGPCQLSLPFFQSLEEKYRKDGLAVIGLHVDDRMPGVDEVRQYLKDKKVHYTNVISTIEVDDAFQVYAMPTTYILDRDGRIAKAHVGFNPSRTPQTMEEHLQELLGTR